LSAVTVYLPGRVPFAVTWVVNRPRRSGVVLAVDDDKVPV